MPIIPDPVDERILYAALQLLRSQGPHAVTMQAITAATGIAKTTLYRRHRDRRALLAAALTRLVTPPPSNAHLDRVELVHWAVTQSIDVIVEGIGPGGFAALLTDSDPDFSGTFREIIRTQRRPVVTVLDGQFGDGETLVDMIVGSYIAEYARTGTVSAGWHDNIAGVLGRLAPTAAPPGRRRRGSRE